MVSGFFLVSQILCDEDDFHAAGMAVVSRHDDVAAHAVLAMALSARPSDFAWRLRMEARGIRRACRGLYALDRRVDIGAYLIHANEHKNLLGAV